MTLLSTALVPATELNRQLDDVFEATMEAHHLTPMQRMVLRELRLGQSNKEIAGQIGLTEQAVKQHLNRLLREFGAQDRLQLVLMLYGILPPCSR